MGKGRPSPLPAAACHSLSADIIGAEAWSSKREVSQCNELLETFPFLYHSVSERQRLPPLTPFPPFHYFSRL